MFWRTPTPINHPGGLLPASERGVSLAQVQPGSMVKISGFGQISAEQKRHLQAYGLLAGRMVQVLAQNPVTIVLVEQTELAFEKEISRQVIIE
jgi:hypothetical protein